VRYAGDAVGRWDLSLMRRIPSDCPVWDELSGLKTTRERAEEKRQEKLDLVREQVESGALVIRQMTAAERRRYPPRPVPPKRSGTQ
jgi:hypothetical protein